MNGRRARLQLADQRLGVALLDDASEAFERFTVVDAVEAVAALEEG